MIKGKLIMVKFSEKSGECTKEIVEARKNGILKNNAMTKKLEDFNTAPNAY